MILLLNIILAFILNDKIDEINRLTNSAEKSFFSKNLMNQLEIIKL